MRATKVADLDLLSDMLLPAVFTQSMFEAVFVCRTSLKDFTIVEVASGLKRKFIVSFCDHL